MVLILIILEYIYINDIEIIIDDAQSLNPYYTGIHLHNDTCYVALNTDYSLNPYYTGIHLHNTFGNNVVVGSCLNPYYTGIHLHATAYLIFCAFYCLNPYYTGIHLHWFGKRLSRGRQ